MYAGVTDVQPLPDFRLLVTFDNGERRVFNAEPYLDKGKFSELRDVSVFNTVRVSFDTVGWANGADLCPEMLYIESEPVDMETTAL